MSRNSQNDKRILIEGASENNLKNVNVSIPRNQLTVVTGLSGSGKSSLAFTTLFAEGQRRFVESLSSYARRFLGQLDKPDVDRIDGITPTISIDQQNQSQNPRSTVGTVTEIYDYFRLLFARAGNVFCPECGTRIESSSVDKIVEQVFNFNNESKLRIVAPIARGRKGEFKNELEELKHDGLVRVRVDDEIMRLDERDEIPRLKKEDPHTVEAVIDRVVLRKNDSDTKTRLSDSIETAVDITDGLVKIEHVNSDESILQSTDFACPECGFAYSEIEPRIFSFNSPYGACGRCSGIGHELEVDADLVFDYDLSLKEGALKPYGSSLDTRFQRRIRQLARNNSIPTDKPIKNLSQKEKNILLYGQRNKPNFTFSTQHDWREWQPNSRIWPVIPYVWKKHQTGSSSRRDRLKQFMTKVDCSECNAQRLQDKTLSITINKKNISECMGLSITDLREYVDNISFSGVEAEIAKPILKEIRDRLKFLDQVGLSYMTLGRSASSLSGGESQRIRLATQIGSRLVGVTYVLDEPTIGLHARDNERLIGTLKELRDLGNTVVVVEHDPQTIETADHTIDLGPEAGYNGGEVIYSGNVNGLKESGGLTGDYLSKEKTIDMPKNRRDPDDLITIKGAKGHNLKDIDVEIPTGAFTCVTGVSGSGKSSLIYETLYPALNRHFNKGTKKPLDFDGIENIEAVNKVVSVDQAPIGRTPRSNPATYTKFFTPIRELFANQTEAKKRGFDKGRFSFNVKKGRCSNCGGSGKKQIEMHFLPDVYVTCEECDGKRYDEETLKVRFKGKTIADVLDMEVSEALDFFSNHNRIKRRLKTLKDVGLGYLSLGQPATTLSGGEAQRIKLARELSKRKTGHTLYLLDEPTTGLHPHDIKKLLNVLHKLVDQGNSVVVIEHNLDVIKNADWIIDLGPDGGDEGGDIIHNGPFDKLLNVDKSYTAKYLKKEVDELE